eukprot:4501482-Pyramimonas_sp.AAC.1
MRQNFMYFTVSHGVPISPGGEGCRVCISWTGQDRVQTIMCDQFHAIEAPDRSEARSAHEVATGAHWP